MKRKAGRLAYARPCRVRFQRVVWYGISIDLGYSPCQLLNCYSANRIGHRSARDEMPLFLLSGWRIRRLMIRRAPDCRATAMLCNVPSGWSTKFGQAELRSRARVDNDREEC